MRAWRDDPPEPAGDPQAHVAFTGVTGRLPRLAVGLQVFRQHGDVHAAQPHEDGQPHLTDTREGLLGGGGHAQWWMRELIRSRGDRGILELVELSLVAERLALPRLQDDFEGLLKARL